MILSRLEKKTMYEKLTASARFIQENKSNTPKIGIILASGLEEFLTEIKSSIAIPYEDIPYFKISFNSEQKNELILGNLYGVEVAVLCGRIHIHEGFDMNDVVFPTRVMATLGIKDLIITNSAGGINTNYEEGDMILIKDHINLMGTNPLIGPEIIELGSRFPNMGSTYSHKTGEIFQNVAKEMSFPLKEGVFAATSGPIYETKAEINMLKTIGADLVGMSSVPEAIAAKHLGLRVSAISCITKMATGIGPQESEKETKAETTTKNFSELLKKAIPQILELE